MISVSVTSSVTSVQTLKRLNQTHELTFIWNPSRLYSLRLDNNARFLLVLALNLAKILVSILNLTGYSSKDSLKHHSSSSVKILEKKNIRDVEKNMHRKICYKTKRSCGRLEFFVFEIEKWDKTWSIFQHYLYKRKTENSIIERYLSTSKLYC